MILNVAFSSGRLVCDDVTTFLLSYVTVVRDRFLLTLILVCSDGAQILWSWWPFGPRFDGVPVAVTTYKRELRGKAQVLVFGDGLEDGALQYCIWSGVFLSFV